MYCVYRNSGRYIHGDALFGGCPLLGGSVIGGSTVFFLAQTITNTTRLSHATKIHFVCCPLHGLP